MRRSEPNIRIMPSSVSTYGDIAAEIMESHDFALDDWQRALLDDWLAVDEHGKWAAKTCGCSLSRQNGKTYALKARCYFGLVLGETILYTAHEVKTERKTFEEIAADFDVESGYPDLSAQTEYIRRANGQEEIRLKDWQDEQGNWNAGGRLIFSARSRGAARGFTADCCFCDEAQELTDEQLSALLPTISASPRQNPQVIMIGTPPAPNCTGEVFKNTRKQALAGDAHGIAWHEWSAALPEAGAPESELWEAIEAANPALDVRILRTSIQSELDTMSRDYFARERLGYWSPETLESTETIIGAEAWNRCATDNPPDDGIKCFAVKFAPDGRRAAVSVCLKSKEALPHVELVEIFDTNAGLAKLAQWLAARKDTTAQIVVDGLSGSGALLDRLTAAGFAKQALIKPTAADAVAAYSSFVDAVNAGSMTHYAQPELTNAATLCTRRQIGKAGGFGWNSTEAADASIIESAALAYRAAITTKRRPGRKAVLY